MPDVPTSLDDARVRQGALPTLHAAAIDACRRAADACALRMLRDIGDNADARIRLAMDGVEVFGATAGVVAGRKDIVRSAFLQNYGIGRPMKVGKEGIAAAIAALQAFAAGDRDAERAALREPLEHWRRALAGVAGVTAELDPDPTGNPFDRLRISVLPDAGFEAVDVVHALEVGTPSIRVRTHQLAHGSFVLDARSLGQGELAAVTERLLASIESARKSRADAGHAVDNLWSPAAMAA